MDWLSFISTETRTLSWPIVLLVIVLILKSQISDLIPVLGRRLISAKGAGIEVSFGEELDKVEDKLAPVDRAEILKHEAQNNVGDAIEKAALPPPYVIQLAFGKIESALKEAVQKTYKEKYPDQSLPAERMFGMVWVKEASDLGIIGRGELSIISELRKLRNDAVHNQEIAISATDALRYDNVVNGIIERLNLQHHPDCNYSTER